jgi:hypothetical protein
LDEALFAGKFDFDNSYTLKWTFILKRFVRKLIMQDGPELKREGELNRHFIRILRALAILLRSVTFLDSQEQKTLNTNRRHEVRGKDGPFGLSSV